MATVLLDTRKTLQADANVIDPTLGEHHHFDQHRSSNISRQTYSKAERVKSMISVKYLYLQRVYETSQQELKHKNIEGVYNPVQILRNRVVRQKEDKQHAELPKVLAIKLLPLACNAFSKHNLHEDNLIHHRKWQMFWSIDLNEFYADLGWRRNNWDRLRRPDGRLWYPSSTSTRLHDQLFEESDSESSGDKKEKDKPFFLEKEKHRHFEGLHSLGHLSHSDDQISSDDHHRRRRKIMARMKKHRKKLRNESEVHSKSDSRSHSESHSDLRSRSSSISAASEEKEPSQIELEVADVHFTAVERPEDYLEKGDIEELEDLDEDDEMKPETSYVENTDLETEIANPLINLRKFNGMVRLRVHYITQIYPQFTRTMEARLNKIIHKQLHEIFTVTASITDYNLPAYQVLYEGFLSEIKTAIHLTNESYSAKIDSLLSTSDRSIGEINTSLLLELRKINEKLDKLRGSLLSSTYISGILMDEPVLDMAMNLEQGEMSKALYAFLENAIVVMLRIVWVVVNVYKVIAYLVKFVWKTVTFVLF